MRRTSGRRKKDLKKLPIEFWHQAKPALAIFGKVTWLLTKIGITLVLAGMVAAGGTATGYAVGVLRDLPEFDPEILERPFLPSYIYDINGNLITEIHDAHNRVPISFEDVPEYLLHAFLAAEDNNFFSHSGFDLWGIARAAYTNIVNPNRFEGASTITQQLVKQEFLTTDRTLERKIQEFYIALSIERQYTKEEIFEFYVNNATFFGNNAYGVEAAAQTYFGKSVGELTLGEAALLAGIPNWPARFAPNPENLEPSLNRRDDVLRRMVRFGYITPQEAQAAMAEEIALVPQQASGWPWPHYIDAVVHTYAVDALMQTGKYESRGEAEQAIRRDGLHIYTALDPDIQKTIQDILYNDSYFPRTTFVYPDDHPRNPGLRFPQAAAVVMDSQTGHVYGMVGGREWNSSNRINRATRAFQPGSAIKPVLVYGPAFEYGVLSPASVLDDAPTAWPAGGDRYYAPENVARTFKGLVTVRDALVFSDNIPAIKAYEMLMRHQGSRAGFDFARSLGLYANWNQGNRYTELGTAIGAHEVTPLAMTQAYSAFANRGIVSEPIFVTRIIDRKGVEIFSATPKQQVVMSEQTAYMMTSILKEVLTRGTGRPSGLANLNFAAKTGTTNNYQDRWVVGYSSKYVITLWMGNDLGEVEINGVKHVIPGTSDGYSFIQRMYGDLVRGVIGKNDVPFPPQPGGLTQVQVCSKSGKLPSEHCTTTVTDWFLRGNEPTQTCDIHVVKRICIVHGLLACEHCPEHLVQEKVFLNRPEVEPTDERWSGPEGRLPADYHLRPPSQTCYFHGPSYTFNVHRDGNTLVFSWDWEAQQPNHDEDQGQSTFQGYNIYWSALGKEGKLNTEVIPIDQRSASFSFTMVPGIEYQFRLMVADSKGNEARRHQPVTITGPLSMVFGATADNGDVVLSWEAPSLPANTVPAATVTGYRLYHNGDFLADATGYQYRHIKPGPGTHNYSIVVIFNHQHQSIPVNLPHSVIIENGNDNGDNDEGE